MKIFTQDPYHYATSWTYSPLQKTQEADSNNFYCWNKWNNSNVIIIFAGLKQKVLSERGETLIVVPCWWDGSDERFL